MTPDCRVFEFLPHGTEFNSPVQIEASYKGADLMDVNESKLRILYFSEENRLWKFIGGRVDMKNKKGDNIFESFFTICSCMEP